MERTPNVPGPVAERTPTPGVHPPRLGVAALERTSDMPAPEAEQTTPTQGGAPS